MSTTLLASTAASAAGNLLATATSVYPTIQGITTTTTSSYSLAAISTSFVSAASAEISPQQQFTATTYSYQATETLLTEATVNSSAFSDQPTTMFAFATVQLSPTTTTTTTSTTTTTTLFVVPTVPATVQVQTSCIDPTKVSIAFRSLDQNTLGVLAENDLTATFFIDPEWAQENVNLIIEANVAGHSFGLSVVNVADLVVPSCTNCDQPVDPVTFPSYVQTVQEEWNIAFGANGIPLALRLVAFTNASYTDLVDTPSTINRYSSLQSAFMAVGISPVVMSFGVDVWIPQSAVENAAVLSNVLGEVQNLDYAYWAARQALAGQLEDPAVVASEASYLATAYALRAVAITECLNGEVN
ncbi:hypothetical protein HDU84_004802 [Entophlyctis sp. JEL0112]|nr:hypothetical protein HDU84_004802 [Entophlyctis sp. JEL0112]